MGDYLDKKEVKKAHNAMNDVYMLKKLLEKLNVTEEIVYKHTKDVNFKEKAKEERKKTDDVKKTLINLDIGKGIKQKLSKAGVTRQIMEESCKTGGPKALELLLRNNITNNKKVILSLYKQLSK